jgi:hypothetical protein
MIDLGLEVRVRLGLGVIDERRGKKRCQIKDVKKFNCERMMMMMMMGCRGIPPE